MRRCLILGLLLPASLIFFEGTASGVVAATQRVTVDSASTSQNKSVTATCPAGTRVLGPGSWIDFGGTNQVLFDDLRPSADLTSVTVNATEDETGTSDNWELTAAAICATPPPGLERVSATSPLNSANKSVTATCPAGKRVFGLGADINTFTPDVILDDLRPSADLTKVTANALEDETGDPFNWSVTAYAVCADAIAGLERVSETGALDSSNQKIQLTTCPGGKVLTGIGADINSFNGQVLLNSVNVGGSDNILLSAVEDETGNPLNWSLTSYLICAPGSRRDFTTSFADSDPKNVNLACLSTGQQVTGLGGVVLNGNREVLIDRFRPDPPNNALVTAFEDDGGFSGNWQLSANEICTTPFPGQEIVSNSTAETSVNKQVTATCPAGKKVVGVAGEVVNGLGQVILDDMRPTADLNSVVVNGVEDETGTFSSWGLTARAICANPPAGLVRVSATSALDSDTPKAATADCPAGKNVLSSGYDINSFNGEVLLGSLSPSNLLTQTTVSGIEDATGNANNWSVTVYGICASA
jgi:hypothetical protein